MNDKTITHHTQVATHSIETEEKIVHNHRNEEVNVDLFISSKRLQGRLAAIILCCLVILACSHRVGGVS